MKAEELIALNEEIAAMARAGLPLDQGLAALAREMRGGLRAFGWFLCAVGVALLLGSVFLALWLPVNHYTIMAWSIATFAGVGLFILGIRYAVAGGTLPGVTADLAEDLRRGQTLPEALARQGKRVPPFYAALVTAGVRTGRIGDVLATLTSYARAMASLRGIILESLFYPAAVLATAIVLVGFLVIYVLPQFQEIYRGFNMKLPFLTEAILAVGQRPVELFFLPVGGLILFFVLTRTVMRATPAGRRAWARLIYTVPLAGTMMRSARLATFTDLLSILVRQGVPLPEAFHLAGEASSDPLLSRLAQQVRASLEQGQPLGEVLRGQGLVPEWVAWMAGLGEQRGQLADALKQIAEMYRRQVEMRAGLLRSVLPSFLVIMTAGTFVTCFVFALMLPMIKLLEGLSK